MSGVGVDKLANIAGARYGTVSVYFEAFGYGAKILRVGKLPFYY